MKVKKVKQILVKKKTKIITSEIMKYMKYMETFLDKG